MALKPWVPAAQTIDEPPDGSVAWLDFSQAPAGVSINLSESTPQAVMPATLNNGPLTLTLEDPQAIDNVLSSGGPLEGRPKLSKAATPEH